MTSREVAVVPYSDAEKPTFGPDKPALFGVRCRERAWFGWTAWRRVVSVNRDQAWVYSRARFLADQALEHGVVPGSYSGEVIAVIELDEETP